MYLLRCADNTLYCGITNDIKRRIEEHNGVGSKGAKYTRSRRPVSLVYREAFDNKSLALKREAEVKRWNKPRKELLAAC